MNETINGKEVDITMTVTIHRRGKDPIVMTGKRRHDVYDKINDTP